MGSELPSASVENIDGSLRLDAAAPPIGSVGAALGSAWAIYRRDFAFIAMTALLVYTPLRLIQSLLVYGVGSGGALSWRLGWLVELILAPWATQAILFGLICRAQAKQAITPVEALGWATRRWGKAVRINILASVLILVGLFALILPGILFAVWFALTMPVIAVEGRAKGVLARSRELTAGYRWRIFGATTIAILTGLGLTFAALLALEVFDTWYISLAADLLIDVMVEFLSVLMLVFYLGIVEARRGTCPSCGYNLTGNVTGVCPECGAAVPDHVRPAAPPQL